jgi:DNA-binding NarL/FixJ family response regulator
MARLLILESDRQLRQLIDLVVREGGHEVIASLGDLEDVRPDRLKSVDLIICDLGFLNPADLACVAQLQRLFPSAKIAGTSGAVVGTNLAEISFRLGLVGILSKPFSIDALLNVISQAEQTIVGKDSDCDG